MARITRKETDSRSFETYQLDLSDDELTALRSAPGDFLRTFLEGEGHTVNGILVDTAFISDTEECEDRELVHLLEGSLNSNWAWRCIPLE